MSRQLQFLTYNIHKGFTANNKKFVLREIKEAILTLNLDLVCLQEVIGHHDQHAHLIPEWDSTSQYEYLAYPHFAHFAYGKNASYRKGNHGNAILSRFPILFSENEDVSLTKIERRGLLHTVIEIPKVVPPLHVFSLHLGLFENDRSIQIRRLSERISREVPPDAPLIIAGDFNDWRENITPVLEQTLNLKEAHLGTEQRHAKTFPAFFPLLALDRIYYRNMNCLSVNPLSTRSWKNLSDHLPLHGVFEI